MEDFITIKPKHIKAFKEQIQEILDLNEESELEEEKLEIYMNLKDWFQNIADDIKQKIYDITGFNSEDDTEEAEESKGN